MRMWRAALGGGNGRGCSGCSGGRSRSRGGIVGRLRQEVRLQLVLRPCGRSCVLAPSVSSRRRRDAHGEGAAVLKQRTCMMHTF